MARAPRLTPRRWLRRLGVILALSIVVLSWRSCSLPPLPPHARAAPALDRLPKLSVCWVEFARKNQWGQLGTPGFSRTWTWKTTASGILIRHPQGDVLVDAGNSRNFAPELDELHFFPRVYLKLAAGDLKTTTPPFEALRKAGADPEKLRWLIPSHSHLDHLGGVMDLPKQVQVLLAKEEIDSIRRGKDERGMLVVPAHARAIEGRMQPVPFAPQPYETFDESADLFGDGSVVVVKLYGHTPGSVGVFVNLGPGRRLLHVGDAIDINEQIERRVGKSLPLLPTDNDRAAANRVVAKLAQLHQMVPDLVVVPAHDRTAYEKFFGPEPTCVER